MKGKILHLTTFENDHFTENGLLNDFIEQWK